MMLVGTRVGPSRIHGQGLFAAECVPCGTPVWRFEPGFDHVITDRALGVLPERAQQHVRWYGWRRQGDGHWVLSGDHACFMNHDARPNTGAAGASGDSVTTVALRDIAAGEELTCDYRAFDADAERKLGV